MYGHITSQSSYRFRMAESLDGKYAASDDYRRSFHGSRMSDSLSMASDYYYDPFCEICAKTKKRNVKHEGFCKDCVQFLCKDCLNVHRNLQGTRGHVIRIGDDMPKSMADKPPKFDYRDFYQLSWKDQFCGTHKVLFCSQCVPLQHKDCPVESIDVACKSVPSSEINALYDKVNDDHSPTRSLPVTQGRGGRTPTGASGQVASKTTPLFKIKAKKLASYKVQFGDERDCTISGIAITNDGRRLLADWDNNKIKLFSRDMKLLCSLSVSTTPRHIAVTGDREAVVSCCDEQRLLILDISDRKMNIKGTVELPFIVFDIAPYQDKLLVTAWSTPTSHRSVKLIDQTGRVYWSTHTDQQGQRLFSCPGYVTCYDDGGSAAVIVSDYGNHTLTVLNADTCDVITRRQVKGKRPGGVTTDTTGNIYVCYYRTDEVAVLTKDLSIENVLLSKRDGLSSRPQVIVYDAVDHQLLVSNTSGDSSNTVDCFKL